MPLRTTSTRHRLQFVAAIFTTVGAVYGVSRLLKPALPHAVALAYVHEPSSPPIVPRIDPPLLAAPPKPPRASPAFLAAAGEGDVAAMEKLYTEGMLLQGALSAAAGSGHRSPVSWLLEHGADVHENESDAEAPVLVADAKADVVKLLLDRGAAEPPLAVAAIAGAPNAVTRLLAQHVSPNPGDGTSPLYDAIRSTIATPQHRRIIVEKLLAAGADPNGGEDSSSPLSAAIEGCEVDGEAAKAPACTALIQMLAARGARVSGATLLTALAVDAGARGAVLDAVLSARLEPDATAFALAQANGEKDALVVRKIAAHGVAWVWEDPASGSVTAPLLEAIDRMDVALVRALLAAGSPADLRLKDGRSPLGLALEKLSSDDTDAPRVVEMLVEKGVAVNRRLSDGRTPLFAAAESGNTRAINALLDHGARVNDRVLDGTALDAAERNGQLAASRVLHSRGGRRSD